MADKSRNLGSQDQDQGRNRGNVESPGRTERGQQGQNQNIGNSQSGSQSSQPGLGRSNKMSENESGSMSDTGDRSSR